MPRALCTATLVAENTYSASCELRGRFNFYLSGISGDTVTLQRSFNSGTSWVDVQDYTADISDTGDEPEMSVCYRFGVKTGNYSAGTIVGRLSQ